MTPDEAKFLLRARRPGVRDALDPQFAGALDQAARDPKLKAWHEAEERFDATVGQKLAEIAPPAGLRESILAGARASGPARRSRWQQPAWLAAAAALVVGAAGIWTWSFRAVGPAEDLPALALRDLAEAHDAHQGRPPGLGAIQARLASAQIGPGATLPIDLEDLRRGRCRTVTIAGREVFEICFQREGVWYHLYATRGRWGDGLLREATHGRLVAAAWSDAQNSYALVTDSGREALRKLL